jgi:hypothetical protein
MKSKLIFILTIFLLLGIGVFGHEVLGQNSEEIVDVTEEDSGIAPDSPLSFLDEALDRAQLALTFNKEKRAKLELKIAEERLREVNLMIQKNKFEIAKRTQLAHRIRLDKAREKITSLDETTSEDTLADLETEIENQELLVEDIEISAISLPVLTEEDKITKDEILRELRASSQATKLRFKERRDELQELRPELSTNYKELRETKLRHKLASRIRHVHDKIVHSEIILERRKDLDTDSAKEHLDLARKKLDEARIELEAGNFEEVKALTLEANNLAVLVRGQSQEAQDKLLNVREVAKTREKIHIRTDILKNDRERLKNAIEVLKERETDVKDRLTDLREKERTRVDEIKKRQDLRIKTRDSRLEIDEKHRANQNDDSTENKESDSTSNSGSRYY